MLPEIGNILAVLAKKQNHNYCYAPFGRSAVIIARLDGPVDLKHLCAVSKQISQAATPKLYESVTLATPNALLEELIEQAEHLPVQHLRHMRRLYLKAPARRRDGEPCFHTYSDHREIPSNDTSQGKRNLEYFISKLRFLISYLEPDKLDTFSWDLQACIPNSFLSDVVSTSTRNNLLEKQTRIENLSLTTDGYCGEETHEPAWFVKLEHLKSIRSLKWTGLAHMQHYLSLRECIKLNTPTIEDLSIHFVDSFPPGHQRDGGYHGPALEPTLEGNKFTTLDLFPLFFNRHKLHLPRLRSLSVINGSFKKLMYPDRCAWKELQHHRGQEVPIPLDLSTLRTLRLKMCVDTMELLYTIVKDHLPIQLRTFEFLDDIVTVATIQPPVSKLDDWKSDTFGLEEFFDAFTGLEDLALCLNQRADWECVVPAILEHRDTLRRLVLHCIDYNTVDGVVPPRRDRTLLWDEVARELYQSCDLDFIGSSCCDVTEAIRDWAPISQQLCCSILHVRATLGHPLDPFVYAWGADMYDSNTMPQYDPATLKRGRDESGTQGLGHPRCPTCVAKGHPVCICGEEAVPPDKFYERSKNLALGHARNECPPNLSKFADWAFGPSGFPELKVLAYGDFSRHGQFARYNWLLCRSLAACTEGGRWFRVLQPSDHELWRLVHANLDMLSACPDPMAPTDGGLGERPIMWANV